MIGCMCWHQMYPTVDFEVVVTPFYNGHFSFEKVPILTISDTVKKKQKKKDLVA